MIPPYLTVTYFSFATGENTLREFPLVIATVAKVSRKRGLWLVVRVNEKAGEIGWSYPDFIGFL